MRSVHVVLPGWVDDPRRPSGGSAYDRRMCDGLAALGWHVRERPVPGRWPRADGAARAALADTLRRVPAGTPVVIDGIVGSAAPDVLSAEAGRLPLVALVHLPLGLEVPSGALRPVDRSRALADADAERRALRSTAAVVVPSRWTRAWLRTAYGMDPARLSVLAPGVDRADPTPPSTAGARLLCVGAVTPVKGQDVLVDALVRVADLAWTCTVVGSAGQDPGFATRVRRRAVSAGLGPRLRFAGTLTAPHLSAEYAEADLLVVASRAETYGMVVTEALAHAVPVLATDVGGLREALGSTAVGRPGLLVPDQDPDALAVGLRRWLTDEQLRAHLRHAAHRRRARLRRWSRTAAGLSGLLDEVAA